MKTIPKQMAACVGVLALSAAGIAAEVSHAQRHVMATDHLVNEVATVLAMTPAQKDTAQTAFAQARQSAEPIRQEMMATTRELRDAIHANDTAQIQRLSTTEGQEIGKLVQIRSTAAANVYKTLTPDQRTRASALEQLVMQGLRNQMENHQARSAS